MKFGTRVHLKPSNDLCEFELDQAISKNDIAENFPLGHETHNTYKWSIFCQADVTLVESYGSC